jgi:uncharacterized protein (TIGR02996 family)
MFIPPPPPEDAEEIRRQRIRNAAQTLTEEEASLIQGIQENIADTARWFVYADWLLEQGRDEEATAIRVYLPNIQAIVEKNDDIRETVLTIAIDGGAEKLELRVLQPELAEWVERFEKHANLAAIDAEVNRQSLLSIVLFITLGLAFVMLMKNLSRDHTLTEIALPEIRPEDIRQK